MRKIFFCAMLSLLCVLQVNAQSFNEEQLEGVWTYKNDGEVYSEYIGRIKEIRMGHSIDEYSHGRSCMSGLIFFSWTNKMMELTKDRGNSNPEEYERILDFFITGNDRLHILVDDKFALHFKIIELDDNIMKLKTPKGIMTFFKTATQVQNVQANADKVEMARYNINGQRLVHPEKGINIIKMNDNSSRKELVR